MRVGETTTREGQLKGRSMITSAEWPESGIRCRNTTLKRRTLSMVMAAAAAMVACSIPAQADPGADAADTIAAVIKALQSRRQMESGVGVANVSITNDGKVKESVVNFRFSGNSSRSDVFDKADGATTFEVSWAENPKNTAMYNGYNAGLMTPPHGQFHRQVGHDFNPDTYERMYAKPLELLLKGILKQPAKSATLDEAGILHIQCSNFNLGGRIQF